MITKRIIFLSFFQIFSTVFKEMYGDKSREFVRGYLELKGLKRKRKLVWVNFHKKTSWIITGGAPVSC